MSTPPAKASTCTSATAPPPSAEVKAESCRPKGRLFAACARIGPRTGSNQISFEAGPSPPRAPPLLCHPVRDRILSANGTPPFRAAFSFAAALFYHPARVQVYRILSAHRLCYPKKGGTAMILALAGNPNCGKTTLFNALTGANARTGNFPGVTVTRSESVCRARPEITLVDLPGVYALRPYSDEERVTRSYLLGGAADAVISIADATCPARSLYLTLQL
ncbi:MAG TPA: hypothetical protein DER43_00005, partial [Clostridiales bacterium]|nr:hypothetical protein [Clostridiales bacterium]